MGNHGSSSSHHHPQYCPSSNGITHETGRRGWTQSFPRELNRYHSQSPGHKVLPEPPNQRLRATNNGSIIHNGGTISGRRPSALTLPHDLNKQGMVRDRGTSASNFTSSRSWKNPDHCRCNCQSNNYQSSGEMHSMTDNEMQEIKRFGSEPDLRYSSTSFERNCCDWQSEQQQQQQQQPQQQHQHPVGNGVVNGHYPERDFRERDSRYKGKKKYKAPAPPPAGNTNGGVLFDVSSPDSYKWNDQRCKTSEEEKRWQPLPQRRSRLFKTRAETQKKSTQPTSTCLSSSSQQQDELHNVNIGNRWRHERASLKETSCSSNNNKWRLDEDYRRGKNDRWISRGEPKRRSKNFDGKNTLQRSMSSPEFQAELMQVARKVRNKLFSGKKFSPSASLDRKKEDQKRFSNKNNDHQSEILPPYEEHKIEDRIVTRVHEECRIIVERNNRIENKTTSYEEHREECVRDTTSGNIARGKDYSDERQSSRRLIGKQEEITRKSLKEKFNSTSGRSFEQSRFNSDNEQEMGFADRRGNNKNRSTKNLNRTRSESPIGRQGGNKIRGQGSGRETTPEPQEFTCNREEENSNASSKKESKDLSDTKRWAESNAVVVEKKEIKSKEKSIRKSETRNSNWHILPSSDKLKPLKTYYFAMDEELTRESKSYPEPQVIQLQSRLQIKENKRTVEASSGDIDDNKNGIEDISLKLRPTLPKKQLEIPRFSPSAAWRLLSALEAPGPTMSTASEEVPVMFEERIERLSRPPAPLVALGPRSSHDKSGDSGISGDAEAPNDDSLEVSTTNRMKAPATRPAWTPQQDLGEESSSDAGVDSPPPMPTPVKFPPRAHVFSLSLPREDNKTYIYNSDAKCKDNSAFNSLQKLKRSVSGAFGLGLADVDRKRSNGDTLDDNWLLSTSAPTSLQHTQITELSHSQPPSGWKPNYENEENEMISEDRTDFPMIMKPPSFSYLASGGHVMYLPESNSTVYQPQSLNYKTTTSFAHDPNSKNAPTKYRKNTMEENKNVSKSMTVEEHQGKPTNKLSKEFGIVRERSFVTETSLKTNPTNKFSNFSKSCENISEMKQRSTPPNVEQHHPQDNTKEKMSDSKTIGQKTNPKVRRFTFQSTVRQIERRRLAEKLSREAEAKERQRKNELEAMQKVEAEFERKRAQEKANIKHQLRLYNMHENNGSLSTPWDSSQHSRADPDGAPSSSASSPTSAPPGTIVTNRKISASSEEYQHKRIPNSDTRQPQQPQREYKDYRPKYYDWLQETTSHIEYKQTTVHPKVICDIPKSSLMFVNANVHSNKTTNLDSTPRSDNYRKDFAHGAVAAKSSLASSDSELSQPNTRPHSRQTGNKSKPLRSRSTSPEQSEEVSEVDESPVEPIKQRRNPINGFILNAVQPFVREKSYRPISFNPQPPPPIPS